MIARIITCTVTPSKVGEFRALLNNDLLPEIQSQHGFVENIEALDPNTGQYYSATLWRNRSAVENYDNGVFPGIAAKMSPLLSGNPTVQTLPVENSSAHQVRAAAATAR
jgi:quinol monooxygenase YgiN